MCHRALLSAVGGGEPAPRARELVELGAWASERERAALAVEREADDVARCFALEQLLYEDGWERAFSGEIVGLISAGAFVAFGGPVAGRARSLHAGPEPAAGAGGAHVFEGLLPMRRMRAVAPEGGAGTPGAGGTAAAERGGEWWELHDLGTLLRGQRTRATLRLGDRIEVRVTRVDAPAGRVDLTAGAADGEG